MEEDLRKNDRYLIEACINKDLAAWSILVKKYSPLIYVSVENRLKKYGLDASSHDIEDIKQNIFSDIWKNGKLSHITNRDDISYWIAILSGNAAIEHFRSREVRLLNNAVSLSCKIDDKELGDIFPSGIPGPNDELARADMEESLELAIESLPASEKLIIKLYLIHGKKYRQIAELLGLPNGTVSSHIKRAKEKLKEALKDNKIL
ncbi:MAG: sigma-70 family RNA polymerase sigma factor [Candidatus Omnitrophica bacterium]|nr:sigma-70 family RNA polymerase sigma factor [Candidatus Omnitrophota bacterium]